MELRDFYNIESQNLVRKECDFLICRCENYMRLHPQAKLWLRDTDHHYNPIRLESENVPFEDYKELTSICPKCGSNIHVDYDNNGYYAEYELRFCKYCQSLVCEDGWTKLQKLLTYLDKIDKVIEDNENKEKENSIFHHFLHKFFHKSINDTGIFNKTLVDSPNVYAIHNQEKALRFKVRVLTKDKKLLYLALNRIRMDGENSLYIIREKDKSDKVQFAGAYLNGRDKNGERLFQGDIVRFVFKHPDGRILTGEGVLANMKQKEGRCFYIIEDNLNNNFPPSPDWIDKNTIEVIGNIFEKPDYKILGGHEAKYYAALIKGVNYKWYEQ